MFSRVILLLSVLAPALFGADYYVDCAAGADSNPGTSPNSAWKTLEKVNTTELGPGDSVRFQRGTTCAGMLAPRGSGAAGRPITIGAYGTGALPVIDAGENKAAVHLADQAFIELSQIEASGGNPHGILVSSSQGVKRHVRIRDVVVHGVRGAPDSKTTGLVAVLGLAEDAAFDDVVIDGVTAYDSTQWAGIVVRGGSKEVRSRNVTIRNSVVHDVFGDGIILFQVEDGLIERSAAWLTGLEPTQTIGTPNGIWTWRCRRCRVAWTEGFFIDSPGVDGGVYDIDWGNEDNVVEHNFGHDAMGYCASVFGASKEVTTNSVVRQNVCVANGRSPKLARRQGDIYLSTWDGGALDGVEISDNLIYWNPPIDAPAIQMDHADFTGKRPNRFQNNVIYSAVPRVAHSSPALAFDDNRYWYPGREAPVWQYGGKEHRGLAALQAAGQEASGTFEDLKLDTMLGQAPDTGGKRISIEGIPGRWSLISFLEEEDADSRAQLVFLQAAVAQYRDLGLDVAVVVPGADDNLRYDWRLDEIRIIERETGGVANWPTTVLVSPAGDTVAQWTGLTPPASLGLTLRAHVGTPAGALPVNPD